MVQQNPHYKFNKLSSLPLPEMEAPFRPAKHGSLTFELCYLLIVQMQHSHR